MKSRNFHTFHCCFVFLLFFVKKTKKDRICDLRKNWKKGKN
jgi:hypothetical protein